MDGQLATLDLLLTLLRRHGVSEYTGSQVSIKFAPPAPQALPEVEAEPAPEPTEDELLFGHFKKVAK